MAMAVRGPVMLASRPHRAVRAAVVKLLVTSMTLCGPNRATRRRASREPIRPPTQGAPKASPYCHGLNPRGPSMSTETSGAVTMIRPLTTTTLKNTGRSAGLTRMYRQPSSRSPARSRGGPVRSGNSSTPPMALSANADNR
jgi:hypothetical protein